MPTTWSKSESGIRIQSCGDIPRDDLLFPAPRCFSRSNDNSTSDESWQLPQLSGGSRHTGTVTMASERENFSHNDEKNWVPQNLGFPADSPETSQYTEHLANSENPFFQHTSPAHLPFDRGLTGTASSHSVGPSHLPLHVPYPPQPDVQYHHRFPQESYSCHSEGYIPLSADTLYSGHQAPQSHVPNRMRQTRESPDRTPTTHHADNSYRRYNQSATNPLSDEVWLRSQGFLKNLPANQPIDLDALQDPRDPNEKPPYSMQQLAAVAIFSHPRKMASSSEIRDMLKTRYQYFVGKRELSETLKHALSSYFLFKRAERTSTQPGRGGLWQLDVVTNPSGRRDRKRGSRQNSLSLEDDERYINQEGQPGATTSSGSSSFHPTDFSSYMAFSPDSEGSGTHSPETGVVSIEFLAAQNHYLQEKEAFAQSLDGLELLSDVPMNDHQPSTSRSSSNASSQDLLVQRSRRRMFRNLGSRSASRNLHDTPAGPPDSSSSDT